MTFGHDGGIVVGATLAVAHRKSADDIGQPLSLACARQLPLHRGAFVAAFDNKLNTKKRLLSQSLFL